MESDRCSVIKLFQSGHTQSDILKILKMPLGRRMFVYRTIKRFKETGSTGDRVRSGRPKSIVTKKVAKAVREQIQRNPRLSVRKMASVMKISRGSLQRVVRNELGMRSFKRKKAHFLTRQVREKRVVRSKGLLSRHAVSRLEKFLFTDEKLFTIEESTNGKKPFVFRI